MVSCKPSVIANAVLCIGEKAVCNADPRARRPACIETFAREWSGCTICGREKDFEPLSPLYSPLSCFDADRFEAHIPFSKTFWLCLVLSTILITPFIARADNTAPEMTVTATQVPTLLPDVLAGVTVIIKVEIQQCGYTSLVQTLAAVPGLGVVQSGGPGGQASVFV